MAEYEVTGVRYQMGDNLTLEQKTQAAEEFIKTLQVGEPLIWRLNLTIPKTARLLRFIGTLPAVWATLSMRVAKTSNHCWMLQVNAMLWCLVTMGM